MGNFNARRSFRWRSSALKENDKESLNNFYFYNDKIKSKPRGDTITVIHHTWLCDYPRLERHHGYVQWLFPLREGGMNWDAQPLSKYEASLFRKSKELINKCIKSYEIMLDFYGFVLEKKSGRLLRNPVNWKERLSHLNRSHHNYLRITRIMKWLGAIGLEHYKFCFVNQMILECYKEKMIPNADSSLINYWIPTLRRSKDVEKMDSLVEKIVGKKVFRKSQGWNQEEKSWFTKFYKDELSKSKHKKSFIVQNEVKVAEKDPFVEARGQRKKEMDALKAKWKREHEEEKKKRAEEAKKKENSSDKKGVSFENSFNSHRGSGKRSEEMNDDDMMVIDSEDEMFMTGGSDASRKEDTMVVSSDEETNIESVNLLVRGRGFSTQGFGSSHVRGGFSLDRWSYYNSRRNIRVSDTCVIILACYCCCFFAGIIIFLAMCILFHNFLF